MMTTLTLIWPLLLLVVLLMVIELIIPSLARESNIMKINTGVDLLVTIPGLTPAPRYSASSLHMSIKPAIFSFISAV